MATGKSLKGSRRQLVEQAGVYVQRFTTDPSALGLTDPQIDDLKTAREMAATAYHDHLEAICASRVATQLWFDRADAFISLSRRTIKAIKAKADLDNDPSLYVISGIPVPDTTPTPGPAPQAPTDLAATISNLGYVQLTWKGTRSKLIATHVWRRLPGELGFMLVGVATGTSWTDTSVPAGTVSANYYAVAASKGLLSATTQIVVVNFGKLHVAA